MKSEWLKQKERRIRCFYGDTLILRSYGISKNPNRIFISCPSRRYKFFEWVDEEKKVGDVCLLALQHPFGQVEGEIRDANVQERTIDRLSIDTEKLNVEIGEVDACVGRSCVELNSVQEQLQRLEEKMKKQTKMQMMGFLFFVILIVTVLCGNIY
ncbi:hypothetical protein AHAS_Ahas16G0231000 [Arachis hypogaea]